LGTTTGPANKIFRLVRENPGLSGLFHVLRALAVLPTASGAEEFDDAGEDRQHDDGADHQMEVALNGRDGAESIAGDNEEPDPRRGAGDIEEAESAVWHLADARDERRERPNDRHETRENDRLAAVLFVERLRADEVLLVEEQRRLALERARPDAVADRVIDRVPEHGGDEEEQHHRPDRERRVL